VSGSEKKNTSAGWISFLKMDESAVVSGRIITTVGSLSWKE